MGLCFAAIFIITIIYIGLVPKVELKTEDGRWRAVFFSEYEDCGWEGMLVYEGKEDISNLHAELLYNGEEKIKEQERLESFHGKLRTKVRLALGVDEEQPVFCEMIAFADKPQEIIIRIKWEENGKPFETMLEYPKKT